MQVLATRTPYDRPHLVLKKPFFSSTRHDYLISAKNLRVVEYETKFGSDSIQVKCSNVQSENNGRYGLSRRMAGLAGASFLLGSSLVNIGVSSVLAEPTAGTKRRNLSIEELKEVIQRDIQEGQYFVTGDLTKDIYEENCRFKDPTNETVGLQKYLQAVSILFDPKVSEQKLLSIEIIAPDTIEAKWTLGGYLKFPWRPRVVPFEGSTKYVVDEDGLVSLHEERWSISPVTALLETLTPSFKSM